MKTLLEALLYPRCWQDALGYAVVGGLIPYVVAQLLK